MTPAEAYAALRDEIETVLVGQDHLIEQFTVALLTRGHVLLEGVPGVAKTTAGHAFARAAGVEYNRIQMTPDVLPADVTGTHVYQEGTGEFYLQRGPIFANVLLIDEINRTTPKTQSALLEAMQERRVTIEGETLSLPTPFMVIATQNPIEMEGTFELPEAQRDRFQFKIVVDTPSRDDERQVLDRFDEDVALDAESIEAVLSPADIESLRKTVAGVHVAAPVKEYILDLVRAVRGHENVDVGASPRAALTLMNAVKARAAIQGREYVIPDDVKALTPPTLRHRMVLNTDADLAGVTPDGVVQGVLESVAPPDATAASETAMD